VRLTIEEIIFFEFAFPNEIKTKAHNNRIIEVLTPVVRSANMQTIAHASNHTSDELIFFIEKQQKNPKAKRVAHSAGEVTNPKGLTVLSTVIA
jgi:hypothetical protein